MRGKPERRGTDGCACEGGARQPTSRPSQTAGLEQSQAAAAAGRPTPRAHLCELLALAAPHVERELGGRGAQPLAQLVRVRVQGLRGAGRRAGRAVGGMRAPPAAATLWRRAPQACGRRTRNGAERRTRAAGRHKRSGMHAWTGTPSPHAAAPGSSIRLEGLLPAAPTCSASVFLDRSYGWEPKRSGCTCQPGQRQQAGTRERASERGRQKGQGGGWGHGMQAGEAEGTRGSGNVMCVQPRLHPQARTWRTMARISRRSVAGSILPQLLRRLV